MKLISWNVNGLRACQGKGFSDIFRQLDADFFCLQETKMQPGQLDIQFEGYESYWNSADKKGYSGTAIFTRHKPLSVSYGLGIDEHDARAVSSRSKCPSSTSSAATPPTLRTGSDASTTA